MSHKDKSKVIKSGDITFFDIRFGDVTRGVAQFMSHESKSKVKKNGGITEKNRK